MAEPIRWPEGLLVPNGGIDETVSSQKLPDHKWTSGADAEALPDGVRLRPGSSRSNTIPLQTIHVSHEDGAGDQEFTDGSSEYIAQSFTVGSDNIFVNRVAVRVKLLSGTRAGLTAGTVACAIMGNDATPSSGADEPDGTELTQAGFAEFTTWDPTDSTTGVDSSATGAEYKWVHFYMDSISGTDDTSADAAFLTDSGASFTTDALIGGIVRNVADNSEGTITDNDGTTVTATLSGGTKNTWNSGDSYIIIPRVELTASTIYHVVFRYTAAEATSNDNIGLEVSSSNGLTGQTSISTTGANDSWTGQGAAVDLNIRVYVDATKPSGTETSDRPPITGIIDYKKSDASTSRHLIVADGEVYKNVGGTLSPVSARERAAMTSGDDLLVDHTVGNDRVFITNDTEVPKSFYVNDSGVERWQNVGIAQPTTSPDIQESGSGNTTYLGADAGQWEVDYYFYDSETGRKSDTWAMGDTDTTNSATITGTGEQIDISGLPAAPVRANDRVDQIRIEVKAPSSTIFRFIKSVDIGTTTATITDADFPATTEAEYVHAVPPVCKAIQVAENRTFALNVASNPWRLVWSTLVGTTPYYDSFPAANFRDFGRGDGDYGTALFFMPPRTLICGFKNSVYALDARRPGSSDILKIATGVGVAGPRAGTVVGSNFFFVSDGRESRGMYRWRAGEQEASLLNGVDDTFKDLNQGRIQYASCAHLAPGDNRFQWWTLLSTSANSGNRILVYDYVLDSWMLYTKHSTRLGSVLGEFEASSQTNMFLGGRDGYEYQHDSGTTDNGKRYTGRFQMKALDFGAPFLFKRFRWIDYVLQQKNTGAVTVLTERDYGDQSAISGSLRQVFDGSSFTLGTSVFGGTDIMGSAGDTIRRIGHRGRARVFRPEFSSEDDWFIRGLSFGVQPTGKR